MGDTALLGAAVGSGTATITLGSAQTLSSLTFSPVAGGSYALSGSGAARCNWPTAAAPRRSRSPAARSSINAPVVLENNVNVTAADGTGLTISGAISQSGGSHG